jgi:fucose permease
MTGLAAVGLFDGALGVLWPSMRATFSQPLAALGMVLLSYTGGYFCTSLAGGWLLERVGTGRALLGVAVTAIAGATTFALAPVWPLVFVGGALLGASGGAADLTLNHELAQHHGVRALGFLHAAWGLGAAIGPVLVTSIVAGGRTWRLALAPIVVVQVALLIAYVIVRDDWHAVPRRVDQPVDAEPFDMAALGLAVALFAVYVGVEAGTGAWGFTLLTEGRGVGDRAAGVWMASYWLALTAGRLVLGFVGDRWAPDSVLRASVLAAIASAAWLWADPLGSGAAALAPLGFALAPVFPVLIAVTPERLGVHRAARAIGLQIAASSVGGVSIPAAMGVGAQAIGTWALAPMVLVSAVALAALHDGALRLQRRTPA